MRGVLLCWIGLALGVELTGIAYAQRAQDDSALAEALFRAGREASARGDSQAACDRYRESFRLEPARGTLLNIAVCEEALGELTRAREHYEQVLPALSPSDSRFTLARKRLQALERRLPRLSILLDEGDPDTTRIAIGATERTASSLSGPLWLDPGEHELRVLAKGHEMRIYPFAISEGEQRTLIVEPGAPIPPIPPSPPQAAELAPAGGAALVQPVAPNHGADPGRVRRALGWVALAVGGAGLATSAVAFGLVIDRKITVDDHCPNRVCDDIGDDASKSGRALSYVSAFSLAGGALATATGLYLLWTAADQPPSSASARVAPLTDRDLLGAQVVGRF